MNMLTSPPLLTACIFTSKDSSNLFENFIELQKTLPSKKKTRQNTGLYWAVSRFVKLHENVVYKCSESMLSLDI